MGYCETKLFGNGSEQNPNCCFFKASSSQRIQRRLERQEHRRVAHKRTAQCRREPAIKSKEPLHSPAAARQSLREGVAETPEFGGPHGVRLHQRLHRVDLRAVGAWRKEGDERIQLSSLRKPIEVRLHG